MKKKTSLSKLESFKYSGVFLLLVMSVTLIVSSCFYYVHIPLTKFHFLGSILLSGIIFNIVKDKFNISKTMIVQVMVILIIKMR